MFDHAGLAIGLSNLMGLAMGLAIWWMERRRRIMWQEHAGYLKTMCDFWKNSSNRMFERCVQARDQAEDWRDSYVATNELDVERHLLPWEGCDDDD